MQKHESTAADRTPTEIANEIFLNMCVAGAAGDAEFEKHLYNRLVVAEWHEREWLKYQRTESSLAIIQKS